MNAVLKTTGLRLGALFVIGAAWALLTWASPAGADPGTTVNVVPTNQHVNLGQTFDVQVGINTDVASRGAQIGLNFNPTIVDYTGWTEGSFYSSWAPSVCDTLVYPEPSESPSGHLTDIGIAILPEPGDTCSGGPTGSGTVVTFHFRGLADGFSPMDLVNVVVSDAQSPPHEIQGVVANDGSVTVGTPPSVGGVAELPEVAQGSGRRFPAAVGSSNWPVPADDLLAVCVVAASVLLGIVAWQAKSRRVL
jgi:hypothetical protein